MASTLLHHPTSPPVRDGGSAWLFVAAAFVCQMLCAGLVQGIGVTFVELQKFFHVGATEIGWVGSCLTFSACSMGIFSGALSRRFGCRPVVVVGGLVASVPMVLASFTTKLVQLYIAISFTGIGCGLVLPAAIAVVGFNFQKYLGIANGLQYAGVGVGIMIIPPLYQYLLQLYGWQGAMLIFGGLLLNTCACGLVMRPSRLEMHSQFQNSTIASSVYCKEKETSNILTKDSKGCMQDNSNRTDETNNKNDHLSSGSKNTCTNQIAQFSVTTSKISSVLEKDFVTLDHEIPEIRSRLWWKPMHKVYLYQVGEIFCKYMGINVIWECPFFFLFAIAVMMFGFGYASCLVYFIPRAVQDVGIEEVDAAFILTILGVCSLAARLTNGFIIDMKWITPITFFSLSTLLCAVSSFLTPFTHSFIQISICAGLFGLASGVANPMLAMVSREIVGQQVMASALGIVLVFNGIGAVIGIFTMGFVYDHYGDYDISFYIASLDLLLIIVLVTVSKIILRNRSSRVVLDNSADEDAQQIPHQLNDSEDDMNATKPRAVMQSFNVVSIESSV